MTTTNPRSVRADASRILDDMAAAENAAELLARDGEAELSSRYQQLYRDLEAADGTLDVLLDVAIAATTQTGSIRYRGIDLTRRLMRLGWTPPAALDPILEGGDDDDD